MSLDNLVDAEEQSSPVLCLPHQCEFLSDTWLQRAREFFAQAVAQALRVRVELASPRRDELRLVDPELA